MSCIIPPHPNCSSLSFVLAKEGSSRELVSWQEREKGGKGGGGERRESRERELVPPSPCCQAAVFFTVIVIAFLHLENQSPTAAPLATCQVPSIIPYYVAPLGGQVVKCPEFIGARMLHHPLLEPLVLLLPPSISVNRLYIELSLDFLELTFCVCPTDWLFQNLSQFSVIFRHHGRRFSIYEVAIW